MPEDEFPGFMLCKTVQILQCRGDGAVPCQDDKNFVAFVSGNERLVSLVEF